MVLLSHQRTPWVLQRADYPRRCVVLVACNNQYGFDMATNQVRSSWSRYIHRQHTAMVGTVCTPSSTARLAVRSSHDPWSRVDCNARLELHFPCPTWLAARHTCPSRYRSAILRQLGTRSGRSWRYAANWRRYKCLVHRLKRQIERVLQDHLLNKCRIVCELIGKKFLHSHYIWQYKAKWFKYFTNDKEKLERHW